MKIHALLIAVLAASPAFAGAKNDMFLQKAIEEQANREAVKEAVVADPSAVACKDVKAGTLENEDLNAIDYNDKNIENYQDPCKTNPRAYQSNEEGEAAPAPKNNVFREEFPKGIKADYDRSIRSGTKSYLE